MQIAQSLVDLGVDVIEAGFPIASPDDFRAVQEISNNFKGAEIAGLCRCNDQDIDRAWEALQRAEAPRIHVFLATSAIANSISVPPTELLVLRKLPADRQLAVRIDLGNALNDPKQRLLVKPGDTLILRYKPQEELINFGFATFFTYGIRQLFQGR